MDREKEIQNIHAGHRNNVRKRYVESGADAFAEHQILELLLFYAVSRRDVNPLAHRLINRFGSLKNVLTASIDELKKEGLSESTAVLLSLTGSIGKIIDRNAAADTCVRNTYDAMLLCHSLLFREKTEAAALICLDLKNRVIRTAIKNDGKAGSISGLPKWIVETALGSNAVSVVLAHNHPSGSPTPSDKDTETTAYLGGLLKSIEVTLFDHIIVTHDACYSMSRGYLLESVSKLKALREASENADEKDTDSAGSSSAG